MTGAGRLCGIARSVLFATGLLLAAGCSEERPPAAPPIDTTPPAAITDLSAYGLRPTLARLRWTAVGDDGVTGKAAVYDVRYSTSPLDAAGWVSATQVASEPEPGAPGEVQQVDLEDLTPGRTYEVAIKTADESINWSDLSNAIRFTTSIGDTTPPGRVGDLVVTTVDESTIGIGFSQVADDSSRVFHYTVDVSTEPIDEASWIDVTEFWDAGPPGEPLTREIRYLAPQTVYYVAVRAYDDSRNRGPISNVASGTTGPGVRPAPIRDLTIVATGETGLIVSWTAVGDDSMTGEADGCEVRVSEAPIDETNWNEALRQFLGPARMPGTPETLAVGLLNEGGTYHVAVKTYDDLGLASAISNVPSATLTDQIPPRQPEGRLTARMRGGPSDVVLEWIAGCDDCPSSSWNRWEDERPAGYAARYASRPIDEASWDAAEVLFTMYGSAWRGYPMQSAPITSLPPGRYWFAMRPFDEVGNIGSISSASLLVPLRLEAEAYVDSRDAGGRPFAASSCPEASGGAALGGLDVDGEWIELDLSLQEPVALTDSLRSAGASRLTRSFEIQYRSTPGGTVVARDTLTTIPGAGIECGADLYDWIGSLKRIRLEPGAYRVRVTRIGGAGEPATIDCIDLRKADG